MYGTPSLLGWTSFSIHFAPPRRATSSETRVFSGAAEEAPRWAMTVGAAGAAAFPAECSTGSAKRAEGEASTRTAASAAEP